MSDYSEVRRGADGQAVVLLDIQGRSVEVDFEITDLVQGLNDAGIATVASCCGHGFRPGNIMLEDGRELIVVPNYREGRRAEAFWPLDIHGRKKGMEVPE